MAYKVSLQGDVRKLLGIIMALQITLVILVFLMTVTTTAMMMMMIGTLMGLLSVIFALGTRKPEKEGGRRGCGQPGRFDFLRFDQVRWQN